MLLVYSRNNIEAFALRALDENLTAWGRPVPLPVEAWWSFLATGPPGGITVGSRVIIPSDHMGPREGPGMKGRGPLGSHVYYSDDGGETWAISPMIPGGNECQAAEA